MNVSNWKQDFVNQVIHNHETSHMVKENTYLMCPCPKCDGDPNRSKDHLHILINENYPLVYGCFRAGCGIRGVVNKQFARRLGIHDTDLLDKIGGESSKKGSRKYRTAYFNNGKLKIPSNISDEAIEYFKSRTGKHLTSETAERFNIFSDLEKFVKLNKGNIENSKINGYAYNHKNKKYIYFLNDTSTSITYRRIDGDGDYSKGKINLVSPKDIFRRHKPYSFFIKDGREIKINGKSVPSLFIAEGIFDILNAYYVANKENIQGTYITSGGNASMVSIIREYSKFNRNANIVIFADQDVPLSYYKKRLFPLFKRFSQVIVYYNKLSKDIGDIRKPIDLKKFTIYKRKEKLK